MAPAPTTPHTMDATHEEERKEELERRHRRKFSYHLLGSKNRLPTDPNDEYDDLLFQHLLVTSSTIFTTPQKQELVRQAKTRLLREMSQSGGDVTTESFQQALEALLPLYDPTKFDPRVKPKNYIPKHVVVDPAPRLEGMWVSLSKPIFEHGRGRTKDGDYMYNLGRMSFGMFEPTDLVCSIQGTFNPVKVVRTKERDAAVQLAPESLERTLREENTLLRTYNTVTAFTIEPFQPEFGSSSPNQNVKKPIQGLLTTSGYAVPSPTDDNQFLVYFTSGSIEVEDDLSTDAVEQWKQVFSSTDNANSPGKPKPRKRWLSLGRAQPQASPIVMEDDGKMSYQLARPVEVDATSNLELLFLDDNLRISRSHSGTIYVSARVPTFDEDYY